MHLYMKRTSHAAIHASQHELKKFLCNTFGTTKAYKHSEVVITVWAAINILGYFFLKLSRRSLIDRNGTARRTAPDRNLWSTGGPMNMCLQLYYDRLLFKQLRESRNWPASILPNKSYKFSEDGSGITDTAVVIAYAERQFPRLQALSIALAWRQRL